MGTTATAENHLFFRSLFSDATKLCKFERLLAAASNL